LPLRRRRRGLHFQPSIFPVARADPATFVGPHEGVDDMGIRSMTVRRFDEIRRRLSEGRGLREIARALGCSRDTEREVRDGLRVSPDAPKTLPDPLWMLQVDWPPLIHDLGLGHPLKFLWEERAQHLTTYSNYWKQFYRKFPQYRQASVTAREFAAGERVEVDYAGDPIEWFDLKTGEIHQAWIFVAVLGFSQLLYARAAEDMQSRNWLGCHRRMFAFYASVTHVLVPDCWKQGALKCHLYDPDLNPAYAALGVHFSTAIVPALAIGFTINVQAVAALLVDHEPAASGEAFATYPVNDDLLDAWRRMLRLLDRPAEIPVLAGMLEREILFRLPQGPQSTKLRLFARAAGRLTEVRRAIAWIRAHYQEPIQVGHLAELAHMSNAAFHRHFRSATAMSPMQYQKQIRLLEARNLLIATPGSAASVAFAVGYESASQFSREYARQFGASPARDAARFLAGGSATT
jgi:AraC-like DNA-binding protein